MMTEEDKSPADDESLGEVDTNETSKPTTKSEDNPAPDDKSSSKEDIQPDTVTKEQYISLSKNLSQKDKIVTDLRKEVEHMKAQQEIKEMVFEDEQAPKELKQLVKSKINNFQTVEGFQAYYDQMKQVYQLGQDNKVAKQAESMSRNQTPVNTDFRQKLDTATSESDLEAAFNALKG